MPPRAFITFTDAGKKNNWRRFKQSCILSGNSPEQVIHDLIAGYLEERSGTPIPRKNLVLGSDLLAAIQDRLDARLDRFWLDYMRNRIKVWKEGVHWFRPTPKKIMYDIDAVWPDITKWVKDHPDIVVPVDKEPRMMHDVDHSFRILGS